MGSYIAAQVRLVGGVVVGVGALVAEKCWLVVGWHPCSGQQNGRRVRPVQVLQGRQLGAWMRLWLCWRRTYLAWRRCGEKLYSFGDVLSLCLWYVNAVASLVEWECANVPTFLAMEVPCAPLLRGLVDEYFFLWRGHGGPVVVEHPI